MRQNCLESNTCASLFEQNLTRTGIRDREFPRRFTAGPKLISLRSYNLFFPKKFEPKKKEPNSFRISNLIFPKEILAKPKSLHSFSHSSMSPLSPDFCYDTYLSGYIDVKKLSFNYFLGQTYLNIKHVFVN